MRDATKWSFDFAGKYRYMFFLGGYSVLTTTFIGIIATQINKVVVPIPLMIQEIWSITVPDNFVPIIMLLATVKVSSLIFLYKVSISSSVSSTLGSEHTGITSAADPVPPANC